MSLTKKMTVVAAGAALTVAMAVPAMALENEFHGGFWLRGTNSNYLNGGTGYLLTPTGSTSGTDTRTTNNWVEQRARLLYTAKANDSLKLVTGFEIDTTWGKSSYTVGRANDGGALGADTVNLETKWVYLDFNEPFSGANFKVGLQGLNDSYKALIFGGGSDAAGIIASKTFGAFTGGIGWFRLDDRTITAAQTLCRDNTTGAVTATTAGGTCAAGTTAISNSGNLVNTNGVTAAVTATNGKNTRDLFIADAKYALNKDMKFGGSYYFLNSDNAGRVAQPGLTGAILSNSTDYNVHILGVNGAATFGPATVDGFLIYEFGTAGTTHVNAFAGNVAAKVKAGPGTARVNALYVSGSSVAGTSNSFVSVNNNTSAAFFESNEGALGNMMLLSRSLQTGGTSQDQYLIADSSFRGQGIIGGAVGYDLTVDRLIASANVGAAATAKNSSRSSDYVGTEINAAVGYKLYDSLTATFEGAYVVLGDYYKNTGTATVELPIRWLAEAVWKDRPKSVIAT